MANIDQYKIKITVEGQQAVDRLKDSIGSLDSTLAKVGFAAFVTGAFRMADAITDISDATGIALENVIAFGNAMSAAGGDANNADKALVTFYKNLEDMANGSDEAENKLNKVGITMQDLKNLSEEQLLQTAINNLADMDQGAGRATAAIDAFGKSFNTIDPKKFKDTFDPEKSKEYAIAIKQAGDAVDNLVKNFKILQQATINVFGPVISELSKFKLDIATAQKLIITVGALFAANFGAKAAGAIYDIVKAIQGWNAATKGQITLQAALLALTGPRGWAMLAGAAVAGTAAIIGLNKALEQNAQAQQDATGKGIDIGPSGIGAFADASEFSKKEAEQRQLAAKAAERTTEQLRKQNQLSNTYRSYLLNLIGLEGDRVDALKQNASVIQQLQNDVIDTEAQINAEKAKGSEANQGIIKQLIEQLKLKQEQAAATLLLNQQEREALNIRKQFVELSQLEGKQVDITNAKNLDNVEEQINKALILGKLTKSQAQIAIELKQREYQRLDEINALTRKIRELNADVNQDQIKQLNDLDKVAKERYELDLKRIKQKYATEQELMESYVAGSVVALENIAQAFKPYQMAQDAIMMGWNKIGSAIDTFIETGKFRFKDFALSIIADLTKMIAKALIFKYIFEPIMGALGLKIPGKAAGGPVKGNTPYLVGEKGPELFVPPTSGKIVPNNQLQSGQNISQSKPTQIVNNYYTVNAVDAKSVAQLFAENRRSLLGAAKMAEREMPYAAR